MDGDCYWKINFWVVTLGSTPTLCWLCSDISMQHVPRWFLLKLTPQTQTVDEFFKKKKKPLRLQAFLAFSAKWRIAFMFSFCCFLFLAFLTNMRFRFFRKWKCTSGAKFSRSYQIIPCLKNCSQNLQSKNYNSTESTLCLCKIIKKRYKYFPISASDNRAHGVILLESDGGR